MDKIPDAPWIRDAERYGVDEAPSPRCPVCGDECELIYADKDGVAVGCDECLEHWNALEWLIAHGKEI